MNEPQSINQKKIDIELWFIKLSWLEAFICLFSVIIVWDVLGCFGNKQLNIFGFDINPTVCGLFIGAGLVFLISLRHWFRSKSNLTKSL